jgi:hypothetical protein
MSDTVTRLARLTLGTKSAASSKELSLETRLVLAYALIAALVIGLSISGLVLGRRRKLRARRLRGIKDHEIAQAAQRRTAGR